ncbi:MAG TPA: succinate dehydrogenase cytochrome b subunit [Polyangiaceae bacterium]|nr:succinate dehydrogenase cytochrome b subunit [Polyangiaceae bacterium]
MAETAVSATKPRLKLADTTTGQKALLAVSGVILFGFTIVHMLGNLQVFLGPEQYNHYAEVLKGNPPLLWITRSVLLVSAVVHIVMVVKLYSRSLAARPVAYRVKKNIATSYAASAMKYSGPALLFYILFHLAHFTFPGVAMGAYEHSPTDAYANFVNGFAVPWVALLYVIANLFLGMHLFHGAFSMLQSIGANHPRYNDRARQVARFFALLVTAGNVILPLSVLTGLVQ